MVRMRRSESGNIFLAIFGAVAMVGLLGASVMTFMKGPLSTSVKLTKINTAESQMTIGAQVAVMAAANQAGSGDCDTDGIVEPIEWRNPTASEPVPTGGGLVPLSLGINKRDPWGTEYGYCVWNHGSATSGGGCGANLLAGGNTTAYSVVALISAGPDKSFTTTCRDFATSDANHNGTIDDLEEPLVSKNLETDDDIITTFTYQEATGVSGGLWSLKAGDPGTAVINKSIESSGVANLKGGVLLPDKSLLDCTDPTNAGVMAKNGTTGIEICDGAGVWTAITGGGVTGNNLVLTPNVSSGMNVNGTCGSATCYSSQVTFTLTNKAATTSPVLAASLSNLTNFEFVSNGCNGQTLATNGECQMVVRAKATGNVSYAGTLNITGGNSPFAMLDGIASSFPGCNAGGQTAGGYYVACGVGTGYNLVVTPAGCTGGNTNPTCNGTTDSMTALMTIQPDNTYHTPMLNCCLGSGAQNTANLMAYQAGMYGFPAVSWCDGLVYAGFDDWFLPSYTELTYLYATRSLIPGFNTSSSRYASSTENGIGTNDDFSAMTGSGGATYTSGGLLNHVRCMRRDPAVTITPVVDTTPMPVSFTISYGGPSETRTSNSVTIYGVTQAVNVSVSGGTNARYSVNGGAYTNAAGTARSGDQITLQVTSPIAGQESIVALTVGSTTSNWLVRTPGNNTIRVFTSTATVNATGVTGANCNTWASAAGLTGTWQPIAAGTGGNLEASLPWNWTRLQNMNGQTVATSVSDFMDGTISASLAYSQTGTPVTGPVWTGYSSGTTYYGNCGGWAGTGGYGAAADGVATTSGAYIGQYASYLNCSNSYRVYCVQTNAVGSDLDPDDVVLTPAVSFTSGGNGTSNTITVLGVTDAVNVTITPSSGTATIIKGGVNLNTTSTTAGLNETLAFVMSAPTSLGTKNTATINIGPDSYTWWVGYADQAKEARTFVMVTGDYGTLGGIPGADALCTQQAASSTLGLSGSWKAILSSSSSSTADNISWNWGVLKTLDGIVVADGGFPDLWDGSLDNPINRDENGTLQPSRNVWSGTNSAGGRAYPAASASVCNDWTSGGSTPNGHCGTSGNTTASWITSGTCNCYSYTRSLYCIEDVGTTSDTTPNNVVVPYKIQVATSSRQISDAVIIGGLSSGVSTTLSVAATGGAPTFRVNGGSEVTSGTIQNGDTVEFFMTAPSSGNSNYRMTMTVSNGATIGRWRVWTGDPTGGVTKRVFVVSPGSSTDTGGIAGLDSQCQSRAASAGLGGTWKAIASGNGASEDEWAVNRIGYNWSALKRIDGQDVVMAGNIWSTDVTPLLNPIVIDPAGATLSVSQVRTGTSFKGFAKIQTSAGQCGGFTISNSGSSSNYLYDGTSGTTSSSWIDNGTASNVAGYSTCHYYGFGYAYCIEQ